MNFSNVTTWTIPEGSVTQVTDSNGDIIWQLNTQQTYYITATYYPITNTTTTKILNNSSTVTKIEYNGTEYNPSTYLKFDRKNQNQTVKFYLNSPSVNVYNLFKGVDRVKAIEIGKDITNVNKDGLSYVSNPNTSSVWFRTATVESGNSVYDSRGGGIVHTATNTLVVGCANTTIDSTVTTIGKGAMACVAYGTDGAIKSSSDDSMPNSYIQWDIPTSVTSLGEQAFYSTIKISRLNVRGYALRTNPDIPTNAFTHFGDNNSTIYIPTGTTLANTVWLNELVTTRQTGYKWSVCANL
jgi:hypothetical protein